ncbi:MAG: glycosyltransferase family 39 protein [Chthoniobacter sp.]|nr:glycosyltransferase family 39 protein [Chthoniobacter sp.]
MAIATPSPLLRAAGRVLRFLTQPPRAAEVMSWILLVAVIVAARVYMAQLLPGYLWSKDSRGYAGAAVLWLDRGHWESDPKRGPVYSLLIAACLKMFGTFDSVVILQHLIGGLLVLGSAVTLRMMCGRRAHWPVIACGLALAVYGQQLFLERLIRNDLLLYAFAFIAFAAWCRALERPARGWLFVCGASAALLALSRNVLAPFPVVVLAALIWHTRGTPRVAALSVAAFLAGFSLPLVGAKIFRQLTIHDRPPQPQPGAMLFARVAQFTVLDGGIEPEVKALIRSDIETYRKRTRLDNNEILVRTAVPRMRNYYDTLGKTPGELDALCWRLATEAIRAHPGLYARQCGQDFLKVQFHLGTSATNPTSGDIRAACKSLSNETGWPLLRAAEIARRLEPAFHNSHLARYKRMNERAWLFAWWPVLWTSLGVTALAIFQRGKMQLWWITSAVSWWFLIVLLCTVGRPLSRYLMPVVPIMFWTLGSGVSLAWNWLTVALETRLRPFTPPLVA